MDNGINTRIFELKNYTNIDSMKYSELERKLLKAGCQLVRSGRNHPLWFSPITGMTFATGNHKSEEVKTGTLKAISKLSGVKL